MDLDDAATRAYVERFLARQAGARVLALLGWSRLSGGAIQQNIALDVKVEDGAHAGRQRWVLRTDALSPVAASRTRAEEFALLRVAAAAGVRVPRPLFLHDGTAQRPAFFVMERVDGVAAGHRLTRPGAIADADRLARELGANLARLHTVRPPSGALTFLGAPTTTPTRVMLAAYRSYLDHWRATFGDVRPALEWGLRWWERRAPRHEPVVLLHRDYRTGNYLVQDGHLAATLDWEFAGWGNPLEDLGWFCAPCWRFAGRARPAGGIAAAAAFLDGYNATAGTAHTEADTRDWQALAQIRWAVIALQQSERFLLHGERSLELALTGRLLPELELDLLRLTPA